SWKSSTRGSVTTSTRLARSSVSTSPRAASVASPARASTPTDLKLPFPRDAGLQLRRASVDASGDREVRTVEGNIDLRILLVDDEPARRELLRITSESDDVVVEEAASGEDALVALRGRLPSAVVLDLRLPGIDGAELCRKLRQRKRTAQLPIVVLSGGDGEE